MTHATDETYSRAGEDHRDDDPAGERLETASDRVCLLVLGMHRSGTSAVCGVLSELGGLRPKREMPPSPQNEKGFFEPEAISEIHERVLESAGLQWLDWEQMPHLWYRSASHAMFFDELVEATKQDFPGTAPFILKDPRICRLTALWLAVLKSLKVHPVVVFQYRHPAAVAQSLKVRDGFPVAHSLLLWLRHVLDAEVGSRGTERSFVNFADLMVDWQTALAIVLKNPRLHLSKQTARAFAVAGDFLDDTLQHHVEKKETQREMQHPWILNTYDALQRLRDDPYDATAMATLDQIRERFDTASSSFTPAFHQLWLRLRQMDRDVERGLQRDAALTLAETRIATLTDLVERNGLTETDPDTSGLDPTSLESRSGRVTDLERALADALQKLDEAQPSAARVEALRMESEAIKQHNVDLQSALDAAVLQLEKSAAAAERLMGLQDRARGKL